MWMTRREAGRVGAAAVVMVVLVVVLNLALLAGAVWVVVAVLRAMGVL